MSRLIRFAVIILLVASRSVFGANLIPQYTVYTTLTINGVLCGYVPQAEGGDPRTNVVVESAVGTAPSKKHITGFSYTPITVEMEFPLAQPVLDLVVAFCANQQPRRTLLLAEYNVNLQPIGTPLQANNARLTEVRFSALDGDEVKVPVRVTLVFAPESTQATIAPAAAAPPKGLIVGASKPDTSSFRMQVGTFPYQHIARIESFTIKQPNVAPPEFSNLTLTLTNTGFADWKTWHNLFVVTGPNDDASEKSGSLELLSANFTTVFYRLQFTHVGIIRAWAAYEGPSSMTRKFQAELYYESLTPVPAPLTAVVATPEAIPAGSTPVATTPPPAAPGTPATTPAPGTPVAGTPPTRVPTGRTIDPVPAAGTPTAPIPAADQGARDPNDFPRLDGTVRKSFSSIRQKTSVQELVIYTSQDTLDAIEESYTNALTPAGWELNTRFEDNNAVGRMHQILLTWKNGLRSVTITLTEVKTGGSEISVNLTTTNQG